MNDVTIAVRLMNRLKYVYGALLLSNVPNKNFRQYFFYWFSIKLVFHLVDMMTILIEILLK